MEWPIPREKAAGGVVALLIVLVGLVAWSAPAEADQPSTITFVSTTATAATTERPSASADTAGVNHEIVGRDGVPMVLVPAGEFTMGDNQREDDERPAHRVYLDAFLMDKYEVTVGQYAKFIEAAGLELPKNWNTMNKPQHQKRPVVFVDWTDAGTYCRWAGKRLPTEAEWEKAARGTDGRVYPWGNDPPTRLHANYGKEAWNDHAALIPVGMLEDGKSPYGIYDMAGNVWEWVSDWYDKSYYTNSPSQNPKGPANGEYKVFRGGSWSTNPQNLRSAARNGNKPALRNFHFGFRCAKTP